MLSCSFSERFLGYSPSPHWSFLVLCISPCPRRCLSGFPNSDLSGEHSKTSTAYIVLLRITIFVHVRNHVNKEKKREYYFSSTSHTTTWLFMYIYMMLYVCVTLTVNKQYTMWGVCSPNIVAKVQLQYNFTFTIGCSVLLSICFGMKIYVSYVLCIH
jgi:hypothetical protein